MRLRPSNSHTAISVCGPSGSVNGTKLVPPRAANLRHLLDEHHCEADECSNWTLDELCRACELEQRTRERLDAGLTTAGRPPGRGRFQARATILTAAARRLDSAELRWQMIKTEKARDELREAFAAYMAICAGLKGGR